MSSLPRDTIVGRYCSISFNVTVMGDNHPIVIDHYVWIEANVAMKHCIKIGNGSIIFSTSVIIKDAPCYSIVGLVPGKVIRKRFGDSQIIQLGSLC